MPVLTIQQAGPRALLLCLLLLASGVAARADYFPKAAFKDYSATGAFPMWSKSWVQLEPRVYVDAQGLPYVEYATGRAYNPVTISALGLLAYNRYLEHHDSGSRAEFLRAADWLKNHQDTACGCWYYDFDFTYLALDETLKKNWISGMAQGMAMSVLTRAYRLTNDSSYLEAAERSLLPLGIPVREGGVQRNFDVAGEARGLTFFEEFPTQPAPAFTLNGFMFTLVGLYDLAQAPNERAAALFAGGMRTLRAALPFFDLGDGSAYDLAHLTRPPRAVHRDASYHLVHITLLNALGTATHDSGLLWYRDHWNSFGTPLEREAIWAEHLGIWIAKRHAVAAGLLLFLLAFLSMRAYRSFRKVIRGRGARRPQNAAVGLPGLVWKRE